MPLKRIPVFIVDDQVMFGDTLGRCISQTTPFSLCGIYRNSADFFSYLDKAAFQERAVCILDVNMPQSSGFDTHERLLKTYPFIKTIFLSVDGSAYLIREAMRRQAACYLVKNCSVDELTEAIEQVYYFGSYFSNDVLSAFDWRRQNWWSDAKLTQASQLLSAREQEILCLICQGLNSHEIAGKLFISIRTVENHRTKIMAKIGASNTAGLVVYAIKNDIFFPV